MIWSDRGEIRGAFESMFSRSEWTIAVSDFSSAEDATVTYNYEIFGLDGTLLERGRSMATVEDGLITGERSIGDFRDDE